MPISFIGRNGETEVDQPCQIKQRCAGVTQLRINCCDFSADINARSRTRNAYEWCVLSLCSLHVLGCDQWRNNGVGRVGKVQGAPECKGPPSAKQIIIITVKCRHNYSNHRMFRWSIAAANTDKRQFKFKLYWCKISKPEWYDYMHDIWSVDSKENLYNCCHQMSSFKAKMHQIRFRLGHRPRPCWGSLQRWALPQTS